MSEEKKVIEIDDEVDVAEAATAAEAVSEIEESNVETEVAELSLEEQLATLEAQAKEYLDGWQRARAELANAKKRFERQRLETAVRSTADVATKILPVLDDFERAVSNVPEHIQDDSWYEGFTLVERKLRTMLESLNIKAIEAVGEPFDPNIHEALSQEPSETYESGTVIRELQKGYKIGERVIRPPLVCVAL